MKTLVIKAFKKNIIKHDTVHKITGKQQNISLTTLHFIIRAKFDQHIT